MKSRLNILLFTFLISIYSVRAQDYYTGKDTIKTATETFVVKNYGSYFSVQNVKNVKMNAFQYDTKTGKLLSEAETGFPTAQPDKAMFAEILKEVFTEEEIAKYSNDGRNGIGLYFVIEPNSGKTLEVEFEILNIPESNNPIMLSVPVSKLERLELLMKQKLFWLVPASNKWKNVSDIRAPYGYF
jgi:hypothetical protein